MAWTDPRTWTDGELVTKAIMDPHVRDNFRVVTHTIPKTADESVTSSTVLQDDDHLTFTLGANELWYVRFAVVYTSASATPNITIAYAGPASVTYQFLTLGETGAGTFTNNYQRAVADTLTFVTGAGTIKQFHTEGIITNAGTSGPFRLQWAQGVSNATATTVKKGSTLIRAKVG